MPSPGTAPGLTPERRAEAVWRAVVEADPKPSITTLIADAIRAAEREAREKAIGECETVIARAQAVFEHAATNKRSLGAVDALRPLFMAQAKACRGLAFKIAALAGREG